jgi:uncharacterized protein
MAVIAALNVYPVKSCRGIALDTASFTDAGIEFDREWMAVDADGGFVTQRTFPRMALIETRFDAGRLCLAAPAMPELIVPLATRSASLRQVQVWRDRVEAVDEGDEASRWFSAFLDAPLRLVRFAPQGRRTSNPAYAAPDTGYARFADGYALLFIASASLADLNARLARKSAAPLPMNRFRPNLVIDGDDIGAYDEDRIAWLRADRIALRPVKPCVRCRITTTDQLTAEVHGEPLVTLAGYRTDAELGGPTFGQNAIVVAGAGQALRVGGRLDVTWNF